MQGDPLGRHVLAEGVSYGTKLIVTYVTKHFPENALASWGNERQGPSTLPMNQIDLAPAIVARMLITIPTMLPYSVMNNESI